VQRKVTISGWQRKEADNYIGLASNHIA
jgi:hypothetical protein